MNDEVDSKPTPVEATGNADESKRNTTKDTTAAAAAAAPAFTTIKSQMESLSIDVLGNLLSFLNLTDVNAVSLTSHRLCFAARSNTLWKLLFERRWNTSDTMASKALAWRGQNWYHSYQAAYNNPDDLWIVHWNCTYPQDGLVPGRCCIYDMPETHAATNQNEEGTTQMSNLEDLCPPCRFFPRHPLQHAPYVPEEVEKENSSNSNAPLNKTDQMARSTTAMIRDFCNQQEIINSSNNNIASSSYQPRTAERAFAQSSTFHRILDTRQYAAAAPGHCNSNHHSTSSARNASTTTSGESSSTIVPSQQAHLMPLKDLLFFNVTEEPLSTQFGMAELEHLRQERQCQQEWEQRTPSTRASRVASVVDGPRTEFWKPAFETAHHSWHQALVMNPEFVRPIVFRISVQRPDCFTVFPSEGYLEPGQSAIITFGVRPLGSLVATAFDTLNAQRMDGTPEWMQRVYNEEGPLPMVPFLVRYKYSSVIPCIPARGYISPHLPQARHHDDDGGGDGDGGGGQMDSANQGNGRETSIRDDTETHDSYPNVADVCWHHKQMLDFHWSGGNSTTVAVEAQEIRSICLSAHVNASYPFAQFSADTLTPFDLVVDSQECNYRSVVSSPLSHDLYHDEAPMLYFAAPQLYEFYQRSIYPHLQRVRLETEVSHAGHVFRSHRKKCPSCRRTSWGARLEEMGQAFVRAKLEHWLWQRRQEVLLKNCITMIRAVYEGHDDMTSLQSAAGQRESTEENEDNAPAVESVLSYARVLQVLYVATRMLLRYRSAPYIGKRIRNILTKHEIVADGLYGMFSLHLSQNPASRYRLSVPWRHSGIYRYQRCTDSIFHPSKSLAEGREQWVEHLKDEPAFMEEFRRLVQTPGRFNVGPQEDINHLGEIAPSKENKMAIQRGHTTDMFMDNPIRSLQIALITVVNPRSVVNHGIYDRIYYPGKVVRRPRFPQLHESVTSMGSPSRYSSREVYSQLQDTLCLNGLMPPSTESIDLPISMRRYLRNIPPMGMGRFPLCIDDGNCTMMQSQENHEPSTTHNSEQEREPNLIGDTESKSDAFPESTYQDTQNDAGKDVCRRFDFLATPRLIPVRTPILQNEDTTGKKLYESTQTRSSSDPNRTNLRSDMARADGRVNDHGDAPLDRRPLLHGPGPRLFNMLWSISAHLGWSVDDPGQTAASVVVDRRLLIGLQWLSVTLMAAPLVCTLVARCVYWIPCKPVDYRLEDLPYPLTSELRFISERECGWLAVLLVTFWLFLGRWTERWTSRDFTRAMMEHISKPVKGSSTLFSRLMLWYNRKWDSICPLFLQRFTYMAPWNGRRMDDLMKHIAFWRSLDLREHNAFLPATIGRGIMFWNDRWRELDVKDEKPRKLLCATVAAAGSFSSSSPFFWMNLLTVFSCSISLGLSMSLRSLECGMSGAAFGSVGSLMQSLNLTTLVILSFLLGQLLGSSGGVLFLAEFVVTSISFILGGAGTISASSVESWTCFFFLSSTAFWGYLFGRVALMDAILRQKLLVKSSLFTITLLFASLGIALAFWVLLFLWRWDVPVSLMILRTSMARTARGATHGASAAAGRNATQRAAYVARNLQ